MISPSLSRCMGSTSQHLKYLRDSIVGLVYPQACSICDMPVESLDEGTVCSQCWSSYERTLADLAACFKCAWPVRVLAPQTGQAVDCHRCQAMNFDLLRYVGPYNGALRAITLALKLRPQLPGRARRLIAKRLGAEGTFWRSHTVIPVPLHSKRIRERGFNQAELLAQQISRLVRLPLETGILVRVIETRRHRAGMDARERTTSLQRAFAVKTIGPLKGSRVLLVDDVFTTGATMNECARALKEAGAGWVSGFALARVID